MSERLPRQVKLFGAVSLLNDFASEMIYPLLPAFVTSVLGGGAVALGAIDGAADAAAAFVKLGAGRLADRPRRRGPLIVAGYTIAVLVRPVIAFTAATWQVIGLRVVDRLGKGVRTAPRDALIADVTPGPQLGRAFGLQRGLDHAGAVLGPLVAWALLTLGGADVRTVILASIVPGIAVLLLAMWAVRDGRRREEAGNGAVDGVPVPAPLPAPPRRWAPTLPLVGISLFYLLHVPETLILLHAQQRGVAVALIPLLWAAVHVVKSASSFAGGALTDRVGPARTMWLGWLGYALVAAGMALATGAQTACAMLLAFGVIAGLTESPERALVAAAAGARRGSGFGVYHAASGGAALAGGLGLGAVYARWGGATAFAGSAGLALGLVVLWPFLSRVSRVPPR